MVSASTASSSSLSSSSGEIHGLAVKIRSATESDTFDLAGLSESTITQVMQDAFAKPFEVCEAKQKWICTTSVHRNFHILTDYDDSFLFVFIEILTILAINDGSYQEYSYISSIGFILLLQEV